MTNVPPKIRSDRAALPNGGKGRPKGAVNKTTKAAKEVIAIAADRLGGAERLLAWVQEDPKNESVFWSSIYPKLIPVQLANADGEPFKVEQVNNDAESFRRRLLQGIVAGTAAGGISATEH